MDNEDDPDEVVMEKWRYRVAHWEAIVKQQFQLSYYGTVSYEISEGMPIHEREYLFGLLKEQKESENKARDEAMKAAKAASANNRSRPSRRTRRGRR